MFMTGQVGKKIAPRGYTFLLNKNLLQIQKESSDILRTMHDKLTLPYFFIYIYYFSVLAKDVY